MIIVSKEHKQEAQCAQKRGGGQLQVFVIFGFIKNKNALKIDILN